MIKILIAVDDSTGSKTAIDKFLSLFTKCTFGEVLLLYVEKIEGKSLMDEIMSDSELATLKESLKGTDYQLSLDKKAKLILDHYKKNLEDNGMSNIKTIVKEGHPADEILKAAKEEKPDLIVVGSRGKRLHNWLMGSVSREVSNSAEISVLITK